ncbi:universal stress protein [Thiococcus pfennigii]|uniref:universal stress protein n=1 Tax=Thiococcus pfennigii TaxID=1057 RepID=UPI0019084165|nr:universal stress protein [Thiococcus pfennigii]MBK1731501.1 hypothetical protein [Thiococcus pfennigii]
MNDAPARIRRIAVALDASPHSLRGLALAAHIAAALGAEIEGVFIEDTELLRSAGLPFLREVRVTTLGESTLDAARLERELRAGARRMRTQLERSAAELGIAWSFRVWRGDLAAEILAAAVDAELFALARIGRFAPLRRPRPPRAAGTLIGVLVEHHPAASRALATAIALGRRGTANLIVVLQAADVDELESLRAQTLAELGDLGADTRLIACDADAAAALPAIVARTGIDLLLLDAASGLLARPSLWTSLEALDCPVLIGR